jgi:phenylacetate-CoA ligase
MSMYWFGENIDGQRVWEQETAWKKVQDKKLTFAQTKIEDILTVLDDFSHEWTEEGPNFKKALKQLESESGFSKEETYKTLKILPGLLKRNSLEQRLKVEFKPLAMLDRFTKPAAFEGQVRVIPLGILLHVTAGNVFLSSIDSLLMGLITKNISILKVSSQNTFFPIFFAQTLLEFDKNRILSDKFAVLHWKGGDESVEAIFKNKVDGIIAWGGEEMIQSYRKDLSPRVKFLDFGPKVSLQVITAEGGLGKDLKKIAQHIVADIIPWDQSACASPQNLYLQEGIKSNELLALIDEAFAAAPKRGVVSEDEAVELLKETYRGYYSELMESGRVISGKESLIHQESNRFLRPSPLNRSVIVKTFKDAKDLYQSLSPFSYYLQSCGYLLGDSEKELYLEHLALAGIKRFAPIGSVTWGMDGAPHDGRFVLRSLTQVIGDELRAMDYGDHQEGLKNSKDLKEHFNHSGHPEGFIFSSGGTTGEPKFVHFSYEEFDFITDMLAVNLRAQGIKSGMTIANLFVAGNLWSSFMAVEKALEKIGAIQLPIGGLCGQENIILYLKKFPVDAVMGIPSLLVSLAEEAQQRGDKLIVPRVFYAGESLSITRQNYLRDIWSVKYFGSAGYASVDAGIIGYQCDQGAPGEHHLFSNLVELKIINEEAVVTSHYRRTMPIKNYRTGDRVEWIAPCKCGRPDPRFRLLGRVDNTINIWSCRVLLEDIEKSILEIDPEVKTFQVVIDEEVRGDGVRERMRLSIESHANKSDELISCMYHNSRDVKDTLSLEQFSSVLTVLWKDSGTIPHNPRTGKISVIVDHRS